MIDTDKYEGHTPGPWVISVEQTAHAPRGKDLLITSIHQHGDRECVNELDDDVCVVEIVYGGNNRLRAKEDAQLIAAAPDLLAEVKRLRMYEVAWKILYDNAIEEGRETRTRTWKEIMELVRCDVREMVDTGDAVFDEWAKRTIGGFEEEHNEVFDEYEGKDEL